MTREKLPDKTLLSRNSAQISFAVVIIVSLLGIIFDRILVKEGLPRPDLMIISNVLTGLFAGGLFFQMAREERAHRDLVRERMKTIAELNHHIRNALQVIKFLGGQQRSGLDALQLQLINDAVERIEWALREVLPRYPIEGQIAGRQGDEEQSKTVGPAA